MSYQPIKPNKIGRTQLFNINIKEIVTFIDWRFYFLAWRISGKFDGIETLHNCPSCEEQWLRSFDESNRPKATEALELFRDTQELLRDIVDNNMLKINASIAFFPAFSNDDDIFINAENGIIHLPILRQQKPSNDGFCYSLADFIANENDYIGAFATTVTGTEDIAKKYELQDDVFRSILIKTLSDRLGEAAAEWLHWRVRVEYWGYDPEENLSVAEILKAKYKGIRPAVGYPSLPDQSFIFDLDPLLKFNEIGISLTENGAMFPNASVCGLYFAHPMSKYFMIGKISDEQLVNYASRKGKTTDEMRKWLASNI